MTDTPILNGQIIGQAERAVRAVLDGLLVEHQITFDQWVGLRTLSNVTGAGARPARNDLATSLAEGLRLEQASASTVVDELIQRGWVTDTETLIAFTPTGAEQHEVISAGITAIADRLYGDLPTADLAVTARVLSTVTERANAAVAA